MSANASGDKPEAPGYIGVGSNTEQEKELHKLEEYNDFKSVSPTPEAKPEKEKETPEGKSGSNTPKIQ
jgi:hypothetical protein